MKDLKERMKGDKGCRNERNYSTFNFNQSFPLLQYSCEKENLKCSDFLDGTNQFSHL